MKVEFFILFHPAEIATNRVLRSADALCFFPLLGLVVFSQALALELLELPSDEFYFLCW